MIENSAIWIANNLFNIIIFGVLGIIAIIILFVVFGKLSTLFEEKHKELFWGSICPVIFGILVGLLFGGMRIISNASMVANFCRGAFIGLIVYYIFKLLIEIFFVVILGEVSIPSLELFFDELFFNKEFKGFLWFDNLMFNIFIWGFPISCFPISYGIYFQMNVRGVLGKIIFFLLGFVIGLFIDLIYCNIIQIPFFSFFEKVQNFLNNVFFYLLLIVSMVAASIYFQITNVIGLNNFSFLLFGIKLSPFLILFGLIVGFIVAQILIFLISLFCFIFSGYHEQGNLIEGLRRVRLPNKKWGFVDEKYKRVIPCIYNEVDNFSDGIARVNLHNKWGYIDKTDKIVIPLKYDDIWHFSEELAPAKLNGKWGFIDKIDEVVIPFKYDEIYNFDEGLARVNIGGKWGCIDKIDKIIIPINYDEINNFFYGCVKVKLRNLWGLIDKSGKEIIPVACYEIDNFADGSYFDGIIKVRVPKKEGDKWELKCGLVDKTGKQITPPYDEIDHFSNERIKIKFKDKWGLIDETGKVIISPAFEEIDHFSNERIKMKFEGKWGLMDITGKIIIPPNVEEIDKFPNGGIKVKFKGKWGVIDETGKEIIPIIYDGMDDSDYYLNRRIKVKLKGKYGFIDETGKEITPIIYDHINDFRNDGFALVERKGVYGLIDKTGEEVVPAKYDEIEEFEHGVAAVRIDDKWGFVNESGEVVVRIKYDSVSYDGHSVFVELDGEEFEIDSEGKRIRTEDD